MDAVAVSGWLCGIDSTDICGSHSAKALSVNRTSLRESPDRWLGIVLVMQSVSRAEQRDQLRRPGASL